MKKIICLILVVSIFSSCNQGNQKADVIPGNDTAASAKDPGDLPFKPLYSSSWSDNVSDEDLKMVLMSYKDWSSGNMKGLSAAMGDTVEYDMNSGKYQKLSNPALMKMWSTTRDSLSSVTIDMHAWRRMYSTDKKEGYIVTWYKETDTYKDGKVDSAYYHDINQVKDGKIVWYSQYKRPALPRK
ncbi:hypothetical protein GZH53_01380 [Flavihumibacter sp. R14]|nr:hypothetical protein [Flavihumibacter soli]